MSAFLRRLGGDVRAEPDFASVIDALNEFPGKAVADANQQAAQGIWQTGGPWCPAGTDP
jgi:hypothetical protein